MRGNSAPASLHASRTRRNSRNRITFSKHGALEGDRQLTVIRSAMQREALVQLLIKMLCNARTGKSLGKEFVERCFSEALKIIDQIRDQTAQLIDDVRFWQNAYVDAPPFKYEKYDNYLTHIIVSLDFVHRFAKFRRLLDADCRRNPFLIPNSKPTGDVAKWKSYHQYHKSLLMLEQHFGRAPVPVYPKVEACLAAANPPEDENRVIDAAAAQAAAKKKKKADQKFLARIAAKEAEIQEKRLAQAQKLAEIREEVEERIKIRGEMLREEEIEAQKEARDLARVERERRRTELAARRRQAEKREAVAEKRMAIAQEERRQVQLQQEVRELRAKSLEKAAAAARREAIKEAQEKQKRRKEVMKRFAESARAARKKEEKARRKAEKLKAERTRQTFEVVAERAMRRQMEIKEARVNREKEDAQRRSDAVNRVAKAAISPKGKSRPTVSTEARVASYSKSIHTLGKRKSALAAAEKQLAASRRRRDAAIQAGDHEGVRRAELAFGALQEAVETQRALVHEVEHELRNWGGQLKPILTQADALKNKHAKPTAKAVQSTPAAHNSQKPRSSRKKKRGSKSKGPDIGSLLLNDDEHFDDEEKVDQKGGGAPSKPDSRPSHRDNDNDNDAVPADDVQQRDANTLYEAATNWETSYSSMVITPHMRAVSRGQQKSESLSEANSASGGPASEKVGSAVSQDMVRIGMEVALKLPPISGLRPKQGTESKLPQHTVSPDESAAWHAKYGNAMTLQPAIATEEM